MEHMEDLDIDIMGIIVDDWKPKNGKQAVIKGQKGNQIIIKGIDIKGLLFATVVSAGIVDADKQVITNDEVEKSCWNYQKKVMEKGFIADINHDGKALEGVKLVENYVDRTSDDYEHKIVINFADNKELMEKAVNSSINGVSPKGHARIVEKGAFEKGVDKLISFFSKGVKEDFDKELEKSKFWKAFDIFKSNVSKWVYDPVKQYDTEKIVLSKPDYDKAVDDFAQILKEIDIEKINKGEPDMKKELADFIATDEGKKELETLGFIAKPAPETSKETLVKAEPEKAPEVITKADFDAYKAESEKKITDLEKALKEVAKGRATGADEIAPEIDIDKMSNDELKTLRETKPEIYKAALEAAAKKRK